MSDPVLFDAAFPSSSDPRVNGCLFYGGGDTPHVWTLEEIRAAPGRFRLFVWVRSNPQMVTPALDAHACVAELSSIGYTKGKAILLDLESAIDQLYVDTFGEVLHQAGYLVWDYGSTSMLFKNPALDGYFPSDPTGTDHVAPGWVGCQFAFCGSYDLDDIAEPALLWDLIVPTTPPGGHVPNNPLPEAALPVKQIEVMSSRNDLVDLFILGADGQIYQKWLDPTNGWQGPIVLS